ncbi:hypothetical protein [Larkinella ripae]
MDKQSHLNWLRLDISSLPRQIKRTEHISFKFADGLHIAPSFDNLASSKSLIATYEAS